MVPHASILLLAALCVGSAYSLKCYTCTGATSNSDCMTVTTCPSGSSYCATSVGTSSIDGTSETAIIKVCAASCTPTTISTSLGSATVSCCSRDLCNTNGAIPTTTIKSLSIKSSYSIIVLVMGILVMLISGSLL